MMQILRPVALALLVGAAATDSHAAELRGTLAVPAAPPAAHHMNAYPGSASSMAGHRMAPRGAVNDAVLWIERVPAAAESALARVPAVHPQLAQKDQCFVPRVVVVAAGGTVDFPNQDPIYHNVFSVSTTRRFDLGKYPKGHSRSVTFARTGLVNVYCDIHSDMAAFVIVAPNHAFVQPAEDGTFALPDLPAGRYQLHVWHPDFGEFTRDVDLSGDRTLALAY
jgi:plastocyanin